MTGLKTMGALATLLLLPILVLASAAAAAESPEGGDNWRWSEEPRNAHTHEQDFGRRVPPAKGRKSAEKESGTSSTAIGDGSSSGFDTLLQSRSGTAPGSTSSIRDIGVCIFTLRNLKSLLL